MLTAKEAAVADQEPASLVGKRINVRWPRDQKWYDAVVEVSDQLAVWWVGYEVACRLAAWCRGAPVSCSTPAGNALWLASACVSAAACLLCYNKFMCVRVLVVVMTFSGASYMHQCHPANELDMLTGNSPWRAWHLAWPTAKQQVLSIQQCCNREPLCGSNFCFCCCIAVATTATVAATTTVAADIDARRVGREGTPSATTLAM